MDFHTHTSEFSACSVVNAEKLLEREKNSGMDAVVLTDHDSFWPRDRLSRLRDRHPELTIFNGAEIEVDSLHHVLTLLPRPSRDVLGISRPDRFRRAVRKRGGFTIAAHPYRVFSDYHERNRDHPLDGVEVASGNMAASRKEEQSRRLAGRWNSKIFASSDAHSTEPIGDFYTIIEGRPENEKQLIECLKSSPTRAVRARHQPHG